jgi:hypothetical protein
MAAKGAPLEQAMFFVLELPAANQGASGVPYTTASHYYQESPHPLTNFVNSVTQFVFSIVDACAGQATDRRIRASLPLMLPRRNWSLLCAPAKAFLIRASVPLAILAVQIQATQLRNLAGHFGSDRPFAIMEYMQ